MNSTNRISQITVVAGVFIWVGIVCGISFIESWLKFQAPGITVNLGLGIGRLVFSMLNKVEIVLAIVVIIAWWQKGSRWKKDSGFIALGISVVVLLVQTLILLPIMDARAELRIAGQSLPPSNMHIYYVGGEVIKITGLVIFGIKSIK